MAPAGLWEGPHNVDPDPFEWHVDDGERDELAARGRRWDVELTLGAILLPYSPPDPGPVKPLSDAVIDVLRTQMRPGRWVCPK